MNTAGGARISRSFAWLNVAQFLGALNDNVFKLLVIFLLVNILGDDKRVSIVTITSAVFVLPFLLFSHAGGVLADRISKRKIIVILKFLEIVTAIIGCVAVRFGSPVGLYTVMFLLCTQGALFGPSKYGIVPELVPTEKLSWANSIMEGLTYLAIILGTFLPSYLLLNVLSENFLMLAVFCVIVAVVGMLASLGIERTPARGGAGHFTPFFVASVFKTLKDMKKDRYLLLAILGSAYFLFLGAFIQQNTLLFGQECLKLKWIESGYLFPVAALGIGLGALAAGRLSGRNIEFGVVPLGAIILTVACLGLSLARSSLNAGAWIFVIGVGSGLFIIPLNSFVQYQSPKERRGEVLACVNFLSFLGVALSAGLLFFFNSVLGLSARGCLIAVGLFAAVLAAVSLKVLPDFFVRFVIMVLTRCIYRIKVTGGDNVPTDGPALLIPNHVTWVDAFLLSATQQRRIRFVMIREIADRKWLKPIFKLMRVIPISPTDPPRQIVASLNEARAALDDGYMVCIFAEGAITRNGNMHSFKAGFERIAKGKECPIIPVYLGDAWGSIFSYCNGKLFSAFPKSIPYSVSVIFGTPMPATSTASEVRQAVLELSAKSFDLKKSKRRTLPAMFVRTARQNWFSPAIGDSTGKQLNFGQTLTSAIALSTELDKITGEQDKVGIVMPASVAGALINLAVTLSGRASVNLNFTASAEAIGFAIRQCNIRTVITSRAFLEKLENFKAPLGTVYIEDILPKLTSANKVVALFKALFYPVRALQSFRRVKSDDLATIIFSSGSTGEPKGVMLTHHNIISNIEAFKMVVRFTRKDSMCGILPFFHSFGFTCTLWCPLTLGFAAFYHPSPIDGGKIAEIVREHRLTTLLTTPTFLFAYIRRAKKEDFASLRIVITGAEKLKKKVADSFEERFGIRPREGYGATELSPVVSLGLPDVEIDGVSQVGAKEGSIGHPIPGVVVKIVDAVSGAPVPVDGQGLVMVKGPNVMTGYLGLAEKTREVLQDGWYNTGDIGKMDNDGFVFLTDRLSRFSKIGGEMVPHGAVEDRLQHALGAVNQVVFVTSAPDEKKGEQLIVFFTPEAGTVEKLQEALSTADLPNLWRPRKENYIPIESFPTLGSGKMDQKKLRDMAKDVAAKKTAPAGSE